MGTPLKERNRAEFKRYKEDVEREGKSFYPFAVLHDSVMSLVVVAVIIGEEKPELGKGINGTWFLLTVATESVAVVGALLLGHEGEPNQAIELIALSSFTLGVVLYLIVMTMLFLRWTFVPLGPDELQPPSWIAAGDSPTATPPIA